MRTEATVNLSDAAVAQVMIPVDNFERGIAFYRDVLGIPFLFAAPPMMAFFKAAPYACSWGHAGLPKAQRGSAIYFSADINAVFATLKASGVHSGPTRISSIEPRSRNCGWPSSPIPTATSSR